MHMIIVGVSMRYLILILCIVLLFSFKPVSLDKLESVKLDYFDIEVKGHLKNPGIFKLKAYGDFEDLLSSLDLFDNSDYDHYSLSKTLSHKEILVIKKREELKLVSINAGTVEDLMTLKGVGNKTALLIIEYRENSGSFMTLEELMNVKGIGEKTFLNLKDYISL